MGQDKNNISRVCPSSLLYIYYAIKKVLML